MKSTPTKFNEETGQFQINKGARLQIKAIADEMGIGIAEAEKYDHRFGAFADLADELTDQFWAMHYPGGEFDEQSVDFEDLRRRIDELLKLIN